MEEAARMPPEEEAARTPLEMAAEEAVRAPEVVVEDRMLVEEVVRTQDEEPEAEEDHTPEDAGHTPPKMEEAARKPTVEEGRMPEEEAVCTEVVTEARNIEDAEAEAEGHTGVDGSVEARADEEDRDAAAVEVRSQERWRRRPVHCIMV